MNNGSRILTVSSKISMPQTYQNYWIARRSDRRNKDLLSSNRYGPNPKKKKKKKRLVPIPWHSIGCRDLSTTPEG